VKLIILDRDGVINYDSKDYIKSPDEWRSIPGSPEAIALLTAAGYTVVVATNQSGVGRGYYTEAILVQIHQKMMDCVKAKGGVIHRIFYCPHRPEDGCSCRKPAAGLFEQIAAAYSISLKNVIAIGDSFRDIQAAEKMDCTPVLVLTGHGRETRQEHPSLADKIFIAQDLLAAVHALLKSNGGL
jgi:D-glycero-D-manno-heptose 1,7-bisphosphate phosphatase